MIKTHLDEIVGEENGGRIQHSAEERTAVCCRIAERAFRHGVERTAEVIRFTACVPVERVQPAPAEEIHGVDFSSWSGYLDRRSEDRRKP